MRDDSGAAIDPGGARRQPRSPADLFRLFNRMALQGFGGVLAVAQIELVERSGWLTREEFVESLSIAQVLPGPNVCNLSLMVGDRFFGWRGAFAALGGMMAAPLLIVLLLAAIYSHWAHLPAVAGALRGMGAVAAGLVLATALRLAWALRSSLLGTPICAALGVATFAAVIVWRVPLVWVVCGLGPLGMALAWWRLRR
ncbi:MAG TPA: chromate transporter [Burkholderiaceae bacterium]|jgi:chromate transporter|nr:chromate transporter [Burkholderiaceae bacterium]